MATLAQKIEAEKRMRDLLEESDLPQPDYVEYGFTCIRLIFNDTKTVVVIDIDDPEGVEVGSRHRRCVDRGRGELPQMERPSHCARVRRGSVSCSRRTSHPAGSVACAVL